MTPKKTCLNCMGEGKVPLDGPRDAQYLTEESTRTHRTVRFGMLAMLAFAVLIAHCGGAPDSPVTEQRKLMETCRWACGAKMQSFTPPSATAAWRCECAP